VGFLHFSTAFAMIALGAGGYHIRPFMGAIHMTRDDMVDSHTAITLPAILTGIIITTEDFPAR
jgi:hypothetical protein